MKLTDYDHLGSLNKVVKRKLQVTSIFSEDKK